MFNYSLFLVISFIVLIAAQHGGGGHGGGGHGGAEKK